MIFNNGGETMKTNQEIAKEIFQGKWGEGLQRKQQLTQAGYDYEKIQSIVDAMAASMPIEDILKHAEEYDREHGLIPIEIHGTETLEIEIDLNKYKAIKLTFVVGDLNV